MEGTSALMNIWLHYLLGDTCAMVDFFLKNWLLEYHITQVTGRSYTLGQEWDDMKCWDIDSSLILLRLPISNLLKYVMNTTTMIPSPYVSYTYLAFLITWSITELHALQYSIAVLYVQYVMLWIDRWQYWVHMTGMNNSCAIPVGTITCNKMIKSHTAVCQNQFSLRQMWVKTRTNHVW